MLDKIKIAREARLDRRWASIRERKYKIYRILLGLNTDSEGIMSMFHCVSVLKEEMECHKEVFQDIPEKEKLIYKSTSAASSFYKITRQAKCWSIINDRNKSYDERERAINECRITLFAFLSFNREKIDILFEAFKDPTSNLEPFECSLLLQCVAAALMEIDLREMEIKIIEG